MKRTPLRRLGKKGREWENTRRRLKAQFLSKGITTCEARLKNCWRDNGLGFAHPAKRRNLKPGELEVVILCCNSCHDQIEGWPEGEMRRFVENKIASRK